TVGGGKHQLTSVVQLAKNDVVAVLVCLQQSRATRHESVGLGGVCIVEYSDARRASIPSDTIVHNRFEHDRALIVDIDFTKTTVTVGLGCHGGQRLGRVERSW